MTGIYKIQSKIKPNRIYIGSSIDIKKRWGEHIFYLKNNKHHSNKLQNHYNKYGIDDLVFSIIVGCDKETLIAYEQFYIDALNPWFNIAIKAGSSLGNKNCLGKKNALGYRHTPEALKKISEAGKGKNTWSKGVKFSDEHKRKISEGLKGHQNALGYKHTIETKIKIGKASIGNAYALGKKHSNESKHKMSIKSKGKAYVKGYKWTEKQKQAQKIAIKKMWAERKMHEESR
jgi:group I intron endonuclease